MLSPAQRDVLYSRDELKARLKDEIRQYEEEVEQSHAMEDSPPPSQSAESGASDKDSEFFSLLDCLTVEGNANQNIDEVDRYVTHQPTLEEKANPSIFWKNHSQSYPKLSILAKEFLSIPSGSVPVEQMFSTAGLIMNSKRSSLKPFNLNMINFIHDNVSQI